jgi:hypothetical protein
LVVSGILRLDTLDDEAVVAVALLDKEMTVLGVDGAAVLGPLAGGLGASVALW